MIPLVHAVGKLRMGLQFIDGLISPERQTAVADYKGLKKGAVMQCQIPGYICYKINALRSVIAP